jgi:DinB family protein/SnoaL-like protein
MSVVIDRRSQLVTVADAYFRGLSQKNMSHVPWHPAVVFRGPLAPGAPEPLRGSAAVRSWFEGLYAALGPVQVIEHYIGDGERSIATRADVHITQPPSVLRVIDRFIVDDGGLIVEQENHYDPRPALGSAPGVMTAQERDLLLDLLVSSQQALIAAVVRLTQDQWTFTPADERWSIAQCAEHLALSEEALLGMVRTQILESPAAPEKTAMARGRDGIVVAAMRDRSQRRKTFDFLEPRSSAPAPAHFIDAFLTRRAATLQFVRETEKALHHHFAPLGPLGDLDGYQWLLLLASHTERHVAQMDEVKAQAGGA